MRVYKETEGKVLVKGENLYNNKSTLELITLNQTMQMIFQDPYASLNPRMTIIDIVAEGLDIHGLTSTKDERKARVTDLLETVGLNKDHGNRYLHVFRGGQRHRIDIARALSVDPVFIFDDEMVNVLDVSIYIK